jgi:hypothetical protein
MIAGMHPDLDWAIGRALERDRQVCAAYGHSFSWVESAWQFLAALCPVRLREAA